MPVDSRFDVRQLKCIEDNLENGAYILNADDIELVRNIVKSFRKVSELRRYPPFNSIFSSLPTHDDVDAVFNVQNNSMDLVLTSNYQSDSSCEDENGLRAVRKKKMVQNSRRFHCTSSSRRRRTDQSGGSRNPVLNDRWFKDLPEGIKYCSLCDIEFQGNRLTLHERELKHNIENRWISTVHDAHSCKLCDTPPMPFTNLKNHLLTTKHEMNFRKILIFDFEEKPSVNTKIYDSTLMQLMYDSNCEIRSLMLSYFLNKICTSFYSTGKRSPRRRCYYCGLCECSVDEKDIETHLKQNVHRNRVAEIIENVDEKLEPVSFEVGIIPSKRNTSRKCFLCDCKLPEDDPEKYKTHLNNILHKKKVKSYFKSPRFSNWERGIILKNGAPYCFFCEVVISTESDMRKHIKDTLHKVYCMS